MYFIGITGGVGTGKSEVMHILEEREDTRVLLADEVAHLLMQKGQPCYKQIIKEFPDQQLLAEDGEFDRIQMAQWLFRDENGRTRINQIVHPAVKEYVLHQVETERKKGKLNFFFFEAALLIEEQYDAICDELWYIDTDDTIRRSRLKASRGYSDEKISQIFASQKSREEFSAVCKEIITNNGTTDELKNQIYNVLRRKIHE